MKIKVIKFGGSSLGKPFESLKGVEKILPIIELEKKSVDKLIIVISAFAGETRRLREIALDSGYAQNSKSFDEILSNGELETSQFLHKNLEARRKGNIGLYSVKNIPIITDNSFGEARILYIKKDDIRNMLAKYDIIVVPGFVGRTINGETTTLGFDGSDTTAVYLAGALNCSCTLYKDVDGICFANPSIIPDSKYLPEINSFDAMKLATLGSNIVHEKALSHANYLGTTIKISPLFAKKENVSGTVIDNKVLPLKIAGITYKKENERAVISVVGTEAKKIDLYSLLNEKKYGAKKHDIDDESINSISIQTSALDEAIKFIYEAYSL